MLREEASWLANNIYSLPSDSVFPMLNLGSSSQDFRTKEQPWIDELLFKPAVDMGYSIIHVDIKDDVGVDLVGNLYDPIFLRKISTLNIKSVLCSSLLEHVLNREEICKILSEIIPNAGYLFVTVPYKYPYHCDPIDTMFRPEIEEFNQLFPTLKISACNIVKGGCLLKSTSTTPALYLLAMIIRIMLPIYQPSRWYDSIRYSLWLFREISATCVVLQKPL
jgi:hypothetical protein